MPRLFTALQQARDSVRGAANGFHGQQRITLSDGITPSRLPTLLALSWQEEPDVELRLFEVSLSQQIKGLHGDLYDLGPSLVKWVTTSWLRRFGAPPPHGRGAGMASAAQAQTYLTGRGAALSAGAGDPHAYGSHARQIQRVLPRVKQEPVIAARVASWEPETRRGILIGQKLVFRQQV